MSCNLCLWQGQLFAVSGVRGAACKQGSASWMMGRLKNVIYVLQPQLLLLLQLQQQQVLGLLPTYASGYKSMSNYESPS